MPRFRVLKNSLLGGQISRDAVGRTDLPQYAHSCEILQNMIPLLSGGAYRRPGTMFQDFVPGAVTTKDPAGSTNGPQSSPPRLFPFIISNQQAYAILIGVNRFGYNAVSDPGGGYLQYYRATGNDNADVTSGVVYGVFPYRSKSLNVAATLTDECAFTRQGGPGALANSGTTDTGSQTIIDIADSLQVFDDDVWSVQFCQANDVMFLTHPDYQPQTIYISSGNPTASPYDYGLTGLALCQSRPYLNQNTTAVTLKATWTAGQNIVGGVGTLTASASFFNNLHGPRNSMCSPGMSATLNDGAIFAIGVGEGANMTGNNTDNGILFMQVTSVTSATVCVVKFLNGVPSNYGSGTTSTVWWESAWSNYRGWPRACGIFQQRLVMAGTIHQPNAIWFTATTAYGAPNSDLNTYSKFTALGDGPNQGITAGATGVLANGQDYSTPHNWVYYPVDDSQGNGQSTGPLGTQPFRISLATTSLDAIQYLSPDQQLFIGTATQEWICAIENGSFDVANSSCTVQSHYGSDLVQAIRIGYELMFVLQNRQEVRAYQYNYFDQSFFGEPIQLFFDEYPLDEEGDTAGLNPYDGRRKYRQIDWDASRSTLWCVDTAGNFFGVTRDRKLQITTWHTHQLGGFNAAHGSGQELTTGLTGQNHFTDSAYFQCDGSVISACSVPSPLSGIRDIWMVVKRSYGTGNANIWSVERIVGANTVRKTAYSIVAPGNAQEPLYLDCAYFAADNVSNPSTTKTVGAQLAGATLNGTYYSEAWGMFAITMQNVVQSDGTVSLQADLPPDQATDLPHTVILGLNYNSIVQPVRPDIPTPIGTGQGAMKRPSKAYIRLFKTLMLKMGSPPEGTQAADLEVVDFDPAVQAAQSPEIFTGDKQVFLPNGFDRDGYVYIVQDQPLPFTLVSLSLEGVEYEQ
jgi:hypothetical protein